MTHHTIRLSPAEAGQLKQLAWHEDTLPLGFLRRAIDDFCADVDTASDLQGGEPAATPSATDEDIHLYRLELTGSQEETIEALQFPGLAEDASVTDKTTHIAHRIIQSMAELSETPLKS